MVVFRNPDESTRAVMLEIAGLEPDELREVERIIGAGDRGSVERLEALVGTRDLDQVRVAHRHVTTKRPGGGARRPRPLMIGQAPARLGDPDKPCTGPSFRRMARICGATTPAGELRFLAQFERTNLLAEFPGSGDGDRGDAFPRRLAERAALQMESRVRDRLVLLMGRNVAWAFGRKLEGAEYFRWEYRLELNATFAVVPHPSGINRWWNDEGNHERARDFFRSLIGVVA